MRNTPRHQIAVAMLAVIPASASVHAQAATKGSTKQLQAADLKAWKTIRATALSSDGKWFAYVVGPNEGDATVIIRSTGADGKEMKFPIGEAAGGGGGGRGGAPGAAAPLVISGDSKWAAFTVYPAAAPGGRAGRGGRGGAGGGGAANGAAPAAPAQNKMALVNLATGEKKEFERVRAFA